MEAVQNEHPVLTKPKRNLNESNLEVYGIIMFDFEPIIIFKYCCEFTDKLV